MSSTDDPRHLSEMIASMHALDPVTQAATMPTTDAAASALAGTRQVTEAEFSGAHSTRETLMSDPAWAKRLLSNDPAAKSELLRLNSIIASRPRDLGNF